MLYGKRESGNFMSNYIWSLHSEAANSKITLNDLANRVKEKII